LLGVNVAAIFGVFSIAGEFLPDFLPISAVVGSTLISPPPY